MCLIFYKMLHLHSTDSDKKGRRSCSLPQRKQQKLVHYIKLKLNIKQQKVIHFYFEGFTSIPTALTADDRNRRIQVYQAIGG